MRRMERDSRIATCSGKPYMELNGRLVMERCGDENSVGMIKFYRTSAFQQIGGFVRALMWDGIDGHRCRMLGWGAGLLWEGTAGPPCRMLGWTGVGGDDPALRFVPLRPRGKSHKNWWTRS